MKKYIFIGLIVLLAVFTRIYRIETNAHFQADEARDLVNIHQIYVEKKITLVGPISADEKKIFSSLTYYLLLPFAIIFQFDPMGTVAGAVFWGLVTFGVFWLLAIKINPKMLIPAGILAAMWWPLVETSRWPWNPNLVPLWMALSIYLSFKKGWVLKILSGTAAGLALHHHFVSLVGDIFVWLKKRSLLWLAGAGVGVVPFILFDWKHPPGLFWSKLIAFNSEHHLPSAAEIWPRLTEAVKFGGKHLLSPGVDLAVLGGLVAAGMLVWDIRNKSKNIYWGLSAFLTLSIFLVYEHEWQYLLVTLPLFWVWLVGKRENWGKTLALSLMVIAGLSSMTKFAKDIFRDDYRGNVRLVSGAARIIKEQVAGQKLEKANLAVLGSEDTDKSGKTYRGVLTTWEVKMKNVNEYAESDNLFVISRKQVNNLQGDAAAEIDGFRNGPVIGDWPIEGTGWRVVQFNRK